MNFMLTGQRRVGKSTIVKKTLEKLGFFAGGFYTSFGNGRENPDKILCIQRADLVPEIDGEHMVAVFSDGKGRALPERFDELGCRFLSESEGTSQLTIMDELGSLEKDAGKFRLAVMEALKSPIPVLGVLRQGLPGWTKEIAERDDVRLFTVTEENREDLPEELAELILRCLLCRPVSGIK